MRPEHMNYLQSSRPLRGDTYFSMSLASELMLLAAAALLALDEPADELAGPCELVSVRMAFIHLLLMPDPPLPL